MKFFRCQISKAQRKITTFLIVSFLCLMANTAIPSLHAHFHESEDASSLLLLTDAHMEDHHVHDHSDGHRSEESHDQPESDSHSSNCHICLIISNFHAQTPIVSLDLNIPYYQQFVYSKNQSTFSNALIVKEFSRGPPSTRI